MTKDEVHVVHQFAQGQDWLSRRALGDIVEESGYPKLAREIRYTYMWRVRVLDGKNVFIDSMTLLCEVEQLKEVAIRAIKRQCKEYGQTFPLWAECSSLRLENGLFVDDTLRTDIELNEEDFE